LNGTGQKVDPFTGKLLFAMIRWRIFTMARNKAMRSEQTELLKSTFIDREVSGILFIRDYIEIQCEFEYKIQLFAPVRVVDDEGEVNLEDRKFACRLLAIIGSRFVGISFDGEDYRFSFSNDLSLLVKRSGDVSGETGAIVETRYGFSEF
jgi:hypothetical protein